MALLVIQDNHIKSMLSDPRFMEAIPCLSSARSGLQSAYKGCGSCGRRRQAARMGIYNQVRNCLAGLTPEQRTKFKALLKTDKVRIIRVSGKQKVPVTF